MYYPLLGGYPIWCVRMLKLLVLVLISKNQTKIEPNFKTRTRVFLEDLDMELDSWFHLCGIEI
jgi:hypothetical protein